MEKKYLFLILCFLWISCSENSKKEAENKKENFLEEKLPKDKKPIDFPQKVESIENAEEVEKAEVNEIENEEVVEEVEEEIIEDEVDDELVLVDYQEFKIRFKAEESFDIHEISIEKKLSEKGLLKRYKSNYSYFDVYDIGKSIDWSGAGNFAEFGQGFYERSKGVYGGKFMQFANRKAFVFYTKLSFSEELNYSNIKKLKSDHEVSPNDKVEAVIIFFGKGNYGYRYIYEKNNEQTKLTSETMEVY